MTRLPQEQQQSGPELWITGLGTQYPEHRLRAEDLEGLASRHCDLQNEGIKKLLAINLNTGIQTRASVLDFKQGFATGPEPPTIQDLDSHFREVGVNLAVQACQKALLEAAISPSEVTHSVAVTCTSQGNPGYNLLVHERIGLRADVDHTLLHGVGCAGGLSIMRVAAQMALASTARGRPARVLAFACELCTPLVRSELAAAEDGAAEGVSVAATLFSDGAAAFVLTNGMGKGKGKAKFQLRAFGNETLPGTMGHMSFLVDGLGARAVLGREIPHCASKAVKKMFNKLSPEYSESCSLPTLEPADFDWALHPGGKAIIDGVQRSMALSDEHLWTSREVYRTRGNSSSPTALIVLDMLRSLHTGGREHIVAASFGPGMVIEMAMLRRCGARE